MRTKFRWLLEPTSTELDEIWDHGVLTLDANVLLDLYRYSKATRESLISSIENFKGGKWLSHQAATEFFRNRKKVIATSKDGFASARKQLEILEKALKAAAESIKGNNIIPEGIAGDLEDEIRSAIRKADAAIEQAAASQPNFLQDDTILARILSLFDNAVGDDFTAEVQEEARKTAEHRKTNRIPPGYKDENKDNDRPYGDYYLWRQVIEYAKTRKRPILLVTSERKEDWWEIHAGRTVGPRPELLREALGYSGQRILIYKTDNFLKYSLQRAERPPNETAIKEIFAISHAAEAGPAVSLKQESTCSTNLVNTGILRVELRRPVKNFTASGRLSPSMEEIPMVDAHLTTWPNELPEHKLSAGAGTTHDFNIHLNSKDRSLYLPSGVYEFEYEVKCASHDNGIPSPVEEDFDSESDPDLKGATT